uniref:Apolipophorin-III n=1 Tax=Clastoptera arizonana TaxID=38151 RepID=A0A1B6C1P1_9HEMI
MNSAPIFLVLAIQGFLTSLAAVTSVRSQLDPILKEFANNANSVAENAKTKTVLLTGEFLKNTSEIVNKAQGNVSSLVTNINNDIQKGIETAQSNVAKVISEFQANFTEKVVEMRKMAESVYSSTTNSLQNSTTKIEQTISDLIKQSEKAITEALNGAFDKIKETVDQNSNKDTGADANKQSENQDK